MAKIDMGYANERFVALSQPFLDLMADNPLTGDLYVNSLGHIVHQSFHRVDAPNGSSHYTLLYCTDGRGSVTIANREYPLPLNHCILIPAGIAYRYQSDRDDPWTLYWVRFSGSKAAIFARQMNGPLSIPPSVYSRIEQRLEIFESLYGLLQGEMSIEKLNFANILFNNFLASFLYVDLFTQSVSEPGCGDNIINRITHFMNENIESDLTLKELAEYAGYSKSYFYRKFVKGTGFAPIDYFIRMKINKASIYLIKTQMTAAQISNKLGFYSPEYFSKTFKRIMGITVSEFRKQGFRL